MSLLTSWSGSLQLISTSEPSGPFSWQARARLIEDRLSDALHQRLTQRFVDRRSAVLVRSRGKDVQADVNQDNEVFVEGVFVGCLEGFRFATDLSAKMQIHLKGILLWLLHFTCFFELI